MKNQYQVLGSHSAPFLPAGSVQEAPANVPPPAEDKRREAGQQAEEPSAEAGERGQEAAQGTEEAAAGDEGCRPAVAPPPGDVQEEAR